MTTDIKLVAYEPFGARLGELPQPISIESADPLSDVPSLAIKYSKHSAGHAHLQKPIEIAREVYNPVTKTWFEPANSRFLLIRTEGDQLDATGNLTYICPGYSWLLGKAKIYPVAKSLMEGQVQDASVTEKTARDALDAAEKALADSMGLSHDRPTTYDTFAPTSTNHMWVDITNTASVVVKIYNDATATWETRTAGTTAAGTAYQRWTEHQSTQAQLRDAQGRLRGTRRVFQGKHAGQVMATLVDEALLRGNRFPGTTFTFTATHDSAGNPWPSTGGNVETNVGTSLLQLLLNFVDAGQLDFRTDGRSVHLYLQDAAMNRDQTGKAVLRYGTDIDEAPDKSTLENLAGEILFIGDEGLTFTRSNPEAPVPWGVWESAMSQSGVDNEAMGSVLAERALQASNRQKVERTRAINFRDTQDTSLPYVDYLPGDYIMAPNSEGVLESQRVQQITLVKMNGVVSGNLVLNDRFLEREIRNQRTTEALVGGGALGGTGGTRREEQYIDLRTPEAPRFLKGSAETQALKGGGYQSILGVEWWWSRTATNGTLMDGGLSHFQAQYRLHQEGTGSVAGNAYSWHSMPDVEPAQWFTVYGPVDTYNPVTQGPAIYELRVRALGLNGKVSGWSPTAMVQVPLDDTPPEPPSRPTASVDGALVTVAWDGKNNVGGRPPVDFTVVTLQEVLIPLDAPYAADGTLTDAYLNGLVWADSGFLTMNTAGSIPVVRKQVDRDWAFRFIAHDLSGNASTPGPPSNLVKPIALVDTAYVAGEINTAKTEINTTTSGLDTRLTQAEGDIVTGPVELGRLTTGELVLGSAVADEIWARKIASKKVIANEVLIGPGNNMFANGAGELGGVDNWGTYLRNEDAVFNAGTAAQASYNTTSTGAITIGNRIPVQEGVKYLPSVLARGDFDGQKIYAEVHWYDRAGVYITNTRFATNATVNATAWSEHSLEVTAPAGAVRADFRIFNNHVNGVQNVGQRTHLANMRFFEKNAGRLVVDGSILAKHIAALAIETGHLKANTITADKADIPSLKSAIIVSDVFQGKSFIGGEFQGGEFRTHSTRTAGVAIFNSTATYDGGFRASRPDGFRTFDVNAETGEVMIAGRIKSGIGQGSPNVIVSNADAAYNGTDQGIWFTNDGGPYGWANPNGKKAVAGVFTLADATKATEDYPLNLRGHGPGGGVRIYSQLDLRARDTIPAMVKSNSSLRLNANGGELRTFSTADTVIGVDLNRVIRFERAGGAYNPSTGSSANMFIDANGFIFKSTSAKKYKSNLTKFMPPEEVLSVPTTIWQDKWALGEYQRLKDKPRPFNREDQSAWSRVNLRWHLGTTAEDAIANGAGELVTYSDTGEIDGFEYDRYAFLLAPFLKILWEDYKARTGNTAPPPTAKPQGPAAGQRF